MVTYLLRQKRQKRLALLLASLRQQRRAAYGRGLIFKSQLAGLKESARQERPSLPG